MRELYTNVINGNITAETVEQARTELAKLDERNEKRKGTQTKAQKENEPIAQAILTALGNGSMLGVDLATAIGQSINKTNGVALNLVKEGKITSTKVKIKGKGERVQYTLVVTEVAEDTAPTEDAPTEDTAPTDGAE